MAGNDDGEVERLTAVLRRLGVGEVLRLRHGPGPGDPLGEVHARPDGTLEVPGALVGGGDGLEVLPRTRIDELIGRLLAVRPDLDLGPASIVDGAGRERTLDGAVRTVGDDDPARFDEALPAQVQRFLAGRTGSSLRAFAPDEDGDIFLVLRGGTVLIQPLRDERQLLVRTPLLTGVTPDPTLDRALGRLGTGRLLRFLEVDGTVWAETVLPAWPFVGAHLDQVLTELDDHVLALVTDLHRMIGGERQYPAGGTDARPDGAAGDPADRDDERGEGREEEQR